MYIFLLQLSGDNVIFYLLAACADFRELCEMRRFGNDSENIPDTSN